MVSMSSYAFNVSVSRHLRAIKQLGNRVPSHEHMRELGRSSKQRKTFPETRLPHEGVCAENIGGPAIIVGSHDYGVGKTADGKSSRTCDD